MSDFSEPAGWRRRKLLKAAAVASFAVVAPKTACGALGERDSRLRRRGKISIRPTL
jgi:hypothetical protein